MTSPVEYGLDPIMHLCSICCRTERRERTTQRLLACDSAEIAWKDCRGGRSSLVEEFRTVLRRQSIHLNILQVAPARRFVRSPCDSNVPIFPRFAQLRKLFGIHADGWWQRSLSRPFYTDDHREPRQQETEKSSTSVRTVSTIVCKC